MTALRKLVPAAFVAFGAACGGDAPGPSAANLALGRPVTLEGARGEAAVVTDGRLAPEGGPPDENAVVFEGVRSALVVDLGAAQPVRAAVLQASAADVYFVEASTDATTWEVVWRLPPVQDVPMLRMRRVVLPRAVTARWLRVRPTTATMAAVAEVQAFAAEPSAWPAQVTNLPTGPLPRWPGLTPERTAVLNTAVATLFLLVATWHALGRGDEGRAAKARRAALSAVGGLALLAWPNYLDFHRYSVVHKWDVFHYYLGGKYLPELGYTRLYACAAVVDAEDGIDLGGQIMRDLRDNTAVPAESELARAGECRGRFSPRRWDEFRHDVRFFRDAVGERRFAAMRIDHGFNGTPAWAVMGGLLARLSPASWAQIHLLVAVDFALLLAVFVILARAFGLEATCLAAAFFGTNALAPFGWTGGAFLRFDWLFWLVAGVAALKAKRPAAAGFALGCAALLRVFPIFAAAGVLLRAAVEAAQARDRRPLTRLAPFAAGAALSVALLTTASMVTGGGPRIWGDFLDNSAKHATTPMSNTIGLSVLLSYRPDARIEVLADPLLPNSFAAWEEHVAASDRRSAPLRWAVALAFVLLLARAVRVVPEWGAALLGLGLVPMTLKLSSYYYAAFTPWAALGTLHPSASLALAALAWTTNVLHGLWSFPDDQYFWLTLAVVTFVVGLTAAFARRAADKGRRAPRR